MPVSFSNLYRHNFIRAAVAIPEVRVADPAFNAAQSIALIEQAARAHAVVVTLPALEQVVSSTRQLDVVAVVGVPLQIDGLLYNCAAVIARGRILGVVPKTFLP